jgi:hypothetical protein
MGGIIQQIAGQGTLQASENTGFLKAVYVATLLRN